MSTIVFPLHHSPLQKEASAWHTFQRKSRSETLPNFDPRSATLNTEMGFVIDSPALAQRIAATFDSTIPANAYEVRLSETGELYWLKCRGEQLVRHDVEPGTSFWQRAVIWFLSQLPIEWLL